MRTRESSAVDAAPGSGARGEPAAARAPGDVIAGKYALRRLLGRGGMGSVWHAKNLTLGTDVAIKLILPSVVTPDAGDRLLLEARAAALIEHPNIVRVFDFGWSERLEPFIVMELLRGSTLGELLASRLRLPPELAVQILLPVCSALATAHGRGIVHRDLKPDNVMLVATPQGPVLPKLVDFGIVKLLRENTMITREGVVLGSPQYMAPEQACGAGHVDERADVWALCVVLYEAIAGFRPYEREGRRLLLSIYTEKPTPTVELGAGDEALWAIVQRGLAFDPGERWPSMRELGAALAEWALAHQVDFDVTGSRIDLQWQSRSSLLELPASCSSRQPVETTEWSPASVPRPSMASLPALPPSVPLPPTPRPSSLIETSQTVAAPSRASSLATTVLPLFVLVLTALMLVSVLWIHGDSSPTAAASTPPPEASSGVVVVSPVQAPAAAASETAPRPAVTPGTAAEPDGPRPRSTGAGRPGAAQTASPQKRKTSAMPMPAVPNF